MGRRTTRIFQRGSDLTLFVEEISEGCAGVGRMEVYYVFSEGLFV